MMYRIMAQHQFSNTGANEPLPEIARVESKAVAERIAEMLRNQQFIASDKRRLNRYSTVIVQEIKE